MKLTLKYFLSLVLFIPFCFANVPDYEDIYINDFANVLNPEDSYVIRQLFEEVFQNTTAHLVFVSLESIDGEISEYATQIGEVWGVGDFEKDNGIVILYVRDINKIWVATGYGVEGVLPDSKIGRYLDEYYVPYRDSGEISSGIREFSFALSEEMIKNHEELFSGETNNSGEIIWIIFFVILLILIIYFISRHGSVSSSRSGVPFILSGGSGRGRGFGGGSFGGGGAGR